MQVVEMPFKFFVASTFFEAQLWIKVTYFEDGTYFIHDMSFKFPGHDVLASVPYQLKAQFKEDKRFDDKMKELMK